MRRVVGGEMRLQWGCFALLLSLSTTGFGSTQCILESSRPFDTFFAQVEEIRKPTVLQFNHSERKQIFALLAEAEYFQRFSAHFKWVLSSHLAFGFKRDLTARQVTESHFAANALSLSDLEAEFDSTRVVELPLAPQHKKSILSGQMTALIMPGNEFSIKTGKGIFRDRDTDIPVVIESVQFHIQSHEISADVVSRAGETIRDYYNRHGLRMARLYLAAELNNESREDPPKDFTAVLFRLGQ